MDGTTTLHQKLKPLAALLRRHGEALLFVLRVVVPLFVRSRRRPVIFSRYAGLGDIICTIPAARELTKRHPGATFIYNCHPDFAAVPRLAGITDYVSSLQHMGLVGHWYRFLLGGFYNFFYGEDRADQVAKEPMITEFCRQFDVPVTDRHPELPVSPRVLGKVKELLAQRGLDPENVVLIHPGPSWKVKEWPPESWTQLVKELKASGHNHIAQLGVGRYLSLGQVEVEKIPGTVSLVDALSVEECFAVLSLARLLIGIDSGLLHIAACTRTPSIGLFGPTLPQYFYQSEFRENFVLAEVECAGCHHRRPRLHWVTGCPFDIQCMRSMEVNAVLRSCSSLLGVATK